MKAGVHTHPYPTDSGFSTGDVTVARRYRISEYTIIPYSKIYKLREADKTKEKEIGIIFTVNKMIYKDGTMKGIKGHSPYDPNHTGVGTISKWYDNDEYIFEFKLE